MLEDGASEVIGGRKEVGALVGHTAVAGFGHTPLSHLAVGIVGGGEIQETGRYDGVFGRRDVTNTHHVGLTNGEEEELLWFGLLLAGY